MINVSQIGIELHVYDEDDKRFIIKIQSSIIVTLYYRQYLKLLKILQDLYKLRFRVISHEVNMVAGPGSDGFYKMVEVVFMKQQ